MPRKLIQGVRPFHMPSDETLKQYSADTIFLLSMHIYKVNARIGTSSRGQKTMLTMVDTGNGLNIFREGCRLEVIETDTAVVSLSSASKHKLQVLGVVKLVVTIGTQA